MIHPHTCRPQGYGGMGYTNVVMTAPIRVLYVDDEAHSLALRKELLERQGNFEVTTSTSASRGLELLEDNEFDCLVSDFNMPGTDGIEFLNAVREDYPSLPFIIFSGEDTEEAVTAAIDEGATDYLPKSTASISYQLFAHRIRQAVEGARANEDADDEADSEPEQVVDDAPARVDTTTVDWRLTDQAVSQGFNWLTASDRDDDDPLTASITSGFSWLFAAESDTSDDAVEWTTLEDFEWVSFGALSAAMPDYSADMADGFAWLMQDAVTADGSQTVATEDGSSSALLSTWQAQRVDAAVTAGGFTWLGDHSSDIAEEVPCPITNCPFRGETTEDVVLHGLQTSLADDTVGLQHRRYDWTVDQVSDSTAAGVNTPTEASSLDQSTDPAESVTSDPADGSATASTDAAGEAAVNADDDRADDDTDRPDRIPEQPAHDINDLADISQEQLASLSMLDLYDIARMLAIPGRGSLSEDELVEAVHDTLTSATAGETATLSEDGPTTAAPRHHREPLRSRLRSADPRRRGATTDRADSPSAADASTDSHAEAAPDATHDHGSQQATTPQQQTGTDDLLAELLRHLANLLSGQSTQRPARQPEDHTPSHGESPSAAADSTQHDADDEPGEAVTNTATGLSATAAESDSGSDSPGSLLSGDELEPLFGEDTEEVEEEFSDAVETTDDGSPISTRGVVDDIADIELSTGASVLHLADAHDDERDAVCHHLLGADEPNNRLLIRCTQVGADELEHLAADANEVKIVAIGYDQRVPPHLEDTVDTSKVNNATDLTRLGIITTSILDSWEDEPYPIHVCFDSINILLQYKDIQQVFQFLHLLLGKLESAEAITHLHLDPDSEAPQDVGIFKTLIGTVVDHTESDLLLKKV